jgi:carboxymethylenebutenolidase
MKIIAASVFFSFFLSLGLIANAQSCCIDKNADWHLLALNADFKASHLPPEPLEYTPASRASMISFNTTDGKDGHAFYVPSDEPTNKVLIIFHEWWGLNDYIKREAENWQKLLGNIDVYAVDLYDGKVAVDAGTAGKLMNELEQKRGETIIKGVLSKIGMDKQVATLGWCMGGTWSFTAAILAGNNAAACVMYYGFPEKEAKRIKTLQTDVLYIWGSQDKFITKQIVDEFGQQVQATGHKFEMHPFDAVHAFANPSNPKYDALVAKKAEAITLKFLKTKLQME